MLCKRKQWLHNQETKAFVAGMDREDVRSLRQRVHTAQAKVTIFLTLPPACPMALNGLVYGPR